jgi:hypothetical protein
MPTASTEPHANHTETTVSLAQDYRLLRLLVSTAATVAYKANPPDYGTSLTLAGMTVGILMLRMLGANHRRRSEGFPTVSF